MSIADIVVLSTWFGSGFIAMVSLWISDMRGKPFDRNYFTCDIVLISLIILALGYASLLFEIGLILHHAKLFTRLIYYVANIGVKHNESTESQKENPK